jgi:hypothetical protein
MQKLANKLSQAEQAVKTGTNPTVPLGSAAPLGAAVPLAGTTAATTVVQTQSTGLPTTVIQDAPVVKETIREREREEIQPILHREIEQPIIRKVTAPMSEVRNVQEQQIYARAAPEFREFKAGGLTPEQQALLAQREASESARYVTHEEVVLPTRVQEVVKEKIVEEVQPVIYREVNVPRTIHVEKDIYEKQVLPPQVVQEVRPMGTFTAGQTTQFTSTTGTQTYTTPLAAQTTVSQFSSTTGPQITPIP